MTRWPACRPIGPRNQPASASSSVLLPDPLGPTRASRWPGSSSTSRSCSTSCGAPSGRSTSPCARSGGKAASAGSTASAAPSLSRSRPCSSGSDCSRRSTSAAAARALARSW
ncbi:hypothetical protein G6F24_017589 [Rhizopus arrhizus]|nr:hypothetical protein G6F24_017589 [Rhizopus arrhizus]